MALPTFVGVGTPGAGIGDVNPTWPGGHQAGDVGWLICETNSQTVAAPAGWTEIADSPQTNTNNTVRITVFYKFAASGAEGAPTVVDPGNHVYAVIVATRGRTSGTPWDVTAGDAVNSTTALSIPGDTTTEADCLVLLLMAWGGDNAGPLVGALTNADLANITERHDAGTTDGDGGGLLIATGEKAVASAYGATTATLGVSQTQARMSIAVRAAPTLVSIAVTPTDPAYVVGQVPVQFTATGTYSDSSTADLTATVTWASSTPATATVSSGGLVTIVGAGTTTISATLGPVSGDSDVTVTAAATSAPIMGDYQIVVSIEGIPYLLTTGPTGIVAAAYEDSPWEDKPVYGGLFVSCQNESELHPYDAFIGGGKCTLWVQPDGADVFGRAIRRKRGGAETQLKALAIRADTTIVVRSTSSFPSSGEAYIGNECFSYTGKTGTTFTGCSRGLYSPFGRDNADQRWGGYHRYGSEVFGVGLESAVTELPRSWKGRMVAVRMHRVVGGVMESWETAEVMFAGTVGEPSIDSDRNTVVVLDHFQVRLRQQTVGRDLWRGRVAEGIVLDGTDRFDLHELVAFVSGDADPLLTAASPANAYEIGFGPHTADQLCSALNAWLAQALADGDIDGSYSFAIAQDTEGVYRLRVVWTIPGVAGDDVFWDLNMPKSVAFFLGATTEPSPDNSATFEFGDNSTANISEVTAGEAEPFRILLTNSGNTTFLIGDQVGVFYNQAAFLPGIPHGPDPNAMFLVDNGQLLIADFDGVDTIQQARAVFDAGGELSTGNLDKQYGRRYGDTAPLEVKQVLYLAGRFDVIVPALFYSSGVAGYNHATHDVFGYGLSAMLPHDVLGDAFLASIAALPGADKQIIVVIDQPVKLTELLNIDFVLRRSHLTFHDGQFLFTSWSTPTAELALWELTQLNKAEPVGNQIAQVTAWRETDEWQAPIVIIHYNRSLTSNQYFGHLTIQDINATDDLGSDAKARQLSARNTFGAFAATGAGVEDLAPDFLIWHAFWSRPVPIAARSFSKDLYGRMKVGDVAVISDPDLPDPDTGGFGTVLQRPCLLMKVMWDYGGRVPGGKGRPPVVRPPVAEGRVAFLSNDRTTPYCPAAQFSGASYNAGTLTFGVAKNEFRDTGFADDVTHFAPSEKIRIIERDPDDPANPLIYERTLVSISGDEMTHQTPALGTDSGETAFDPAKTYYVISRDYADAAATQKTKCYQADDGTGTIQNLAQPYELGDVVMNPGYTPSTHDELPERYAEASYGDGVALDVAHERGLVRMINNLADHKACVQYPMLDSVVAGASVGGGSTYELVRMEPIYIGQRSMQSFRDQLVYVAPEFRSKTGASVTCRVTLSPAPSFAASRMDVSMPVDAVTVTFTTSSTSFVHPTALGISLRSMPPLSWIWIEGSNDCEVTGLHEFVIRERVDV